MKNTNGIKQLDDEDLRDALDTVVAEVITRAPRMSRVARTKREADYYAMGSVVQAAINATSDKDMVREMLRRIAETDSFWETTATATSQ